MLPVRAAHGREELHVKVKAFLVIPGIYGGGMHAHKASGYVSAQPLTLRVSPAQSPQRPWADGEQMTAFTAEYRFHGFPAGQKEIAGHIYLQCSREPAAMQPESAPAWNNFIRQGLSSSS